MKKKLTRLFIIAIVVAGTMALKPISHFSIEGTNNIKGDIISTEEVPTADSTKVQHYIDAVDQYLQSLTYKDLQGILSLYADSATIEDPVGSEIVSGKDELREFYTAAVNIDLVLNRTGPVRIAGNEVAFPFRLQLKQNGVITITDIIDVFRFNKAGKIVSMRAFHGPSNRRTVRE